MEIAPLPLAHPLAEPRAAGVAARSDADLRAAAQSFEASFLAEMLQHSGLNAMPAGFGGGAGEEAFSSLLTEEYARLLSERGGVGLAERIFDILKQGTSDT
jgi:Rod binding domain-containing protein